MNKLDIIWLTSESINRIKSDSVSVIYSSVYYVQSKKSMREMDIYRRTLTGPRDLDAVLLYMLITSNSNIGSIYKNKLPISPHDNLSDILSYIVTDVYTNIPVTIVNRDSEYNAIISQIKLIDINQRDYLVIKPNPVPIPANSITIRTNIEQLYGKVMSCF